MQIEPSVTKTLMDMELVSQMIIDGDQNSDDEASPSAQKEELLNRQGSGMKI